MRVRPFHRHSWIAAFHEVQTRIIFEAENINCSRSQKLVLGKIHDFCARQLQKGQSPPTFTNKELAGKYSVSLRTVTNWRREGCPFDAGQVKVLDWLSQRRYAPAGTREKFDRQLAKRDTFPFVSRQFWQVYDQARQLKRDYLNDGLEPPGWLKPFRATRRTKGIPTGYIAKRHRKGTKGGKPSKKVNYDLKSLVAASKVVVGNDSNT